LPIALAFILKAPIKARIKLLPLLFKPEDGPGEEVGWNEGRSSKAMVVEEGDEAKTGGGGLPLDHWLLV
jgi:hypothetical protein